MISLFPYQEAAAESTIHAFDSGHRQVIIQMPTGAGKTVLYLFLAKLPRWKRVLVVAHRKELIDQPIDKIAEIWPDAEYGIVRAERDGYYARNIVFASVQSASRPERLARLMKMHFDFIVIDEAHRTAAPSYQAILNAFPLARVVGLTATPGRADKKTLFEAGYTAFAYRLHIDDAVRYDILAPFEVVRTTIDGLDMRGVKTDEETGDFDQKQLSERARKDRCVARAVPKIWEKLAGGRRAIVFTPSAVVAKQTVEEGRKLGHRCDFVSDKDTDEEREKKISAFKRGQHDYLVNFGILTEGYDDPECSCAIIARLTRSKGTYIQMFGRVLRKHPKKTHAVVIDCAPNYETHGIIYGVDLKKKRTKEEKTDEAQGLPVLAEFAAEDPVGAEDGAEAPEEARGDHRAAEVADPDESAADPRVESLLAETSGGALALGATRKTIASRRVAWLECGPDLYAIPLRDEDHIVLRSEGGLWIAHTSKEELIRHKDMSLAQGVAEQHARERGATTLTKEDALWRSAPANDGQLASLDQLRTFYTEGVTQGEAADLITSATVKERWG